MKAFTGFFFYWCICLILVMPNPSQGQILKGMEPFEIYKIAEVYRTSDLAFKSTVTVIDSAMPGTLIGQDTGMHACQNGMYWSLQDSTETIQGTSFSILLLQRDSTIIVNRRKQYTNLFDLPLTDSLFLSTALDSMQVTSMNDSTYRLQLFFAPTSAFQEYVLTYDKKKYLIRSISYYHRSDVDPDVPGSSGVLLIHMTFTNYLPGQNNSFLFDDLKYVRREAGNIILQPAYSMYQLMIADLNLED